MANEVLVKMGTAICWADSVDYNSAGSGIARTDQIALAGVLDTEAREGAKADLTATRAEAYAVLVGIEMAVAPTAGEAIYIYWSESYAGAAGTGNSGGASGADADYKNGEEAEWVKQLTFVGALILTNDGPGTVQRACVNDRFNPPTRYGMPVVLNEAGQNLDADDIQMYVALVPRTDEIQ